MAILLAEAGLLGRSVLLGTDCRVEAVRQARAARYRPAGLEPTLRGLYFDPVGESFQVSQRLRRHTHWEVADLAAATADGPWDIILWRNLAIYLNPRRADALWRRLAAALAPGGYLIVGKAERPPSELNLSPVCRCIHRRRAFPLETAGSNWNGKRS